MKTHLKVALVFATLLFPGPGAFSQTTDTKQSGVQDTKPANCRVTLPSDGQFVPPPFPDDPNSTSPGGRTAPPTRSGSDALRFWFGTESLWTILPVDGTWRASAPGKVGDFVYTDKLPWFRLHPAFSGSLTITGKRLDGPAQSFTSTFEGNAFPRDDDNAMIMSGILVPTFGCWEITGHYAYQELSFTVRVVPPPGYGSNALSTYNNNPTGDTGGRMASADGPRPIPRIRVDGDVQAKRLFYMVMPETPPAPGTANITGTVVLHVIISRNGRVQEIQYVSGPPPLAKAAIDAVLWWIYRATMIDNEWVQVDTTIDVSFPAAPHTN